MAPHRLQTLIVTWVAAGFLGLNTATAEPRVVASVPPVHALVAGVMEGVGEPTLIVRGVGSAHTYSLHPSEARALSEADIVFWVGPIYERFLEKPLATLATKARRVELDRAPDVSLLPVREGGAWENHDDAHGHDHGAPDPSEMDGHMFLDPENAKAIVRAAVANLSDVDPANAPRYAANGDRTIARLGALDSELRGILAPVKDKPFIVFHDAYQYFERRYDLNAVGSITVSPERPPGARRLQRLRKKIADLGTVCVFAEPQFEPALVQTVVERTSAKTGILDPLGAGIAPGPDAYFVTMRSLARSLADCLGL
jgi:zinc transport system substrate-binding protein